MTTTNPPSPAAMEAAKDIAEIAWNEVRDAGHHPKHAGANETSELSTIKFATIIQSACDQYAVEKVRGMIEVLGDFAEEECCIVSHPQQYREGHCRHCKAVKALSSPPLAGVEDNITRKYGDLLLLVEKACIDHNHDGTPVRYGEYNDNESNPVFVPPATLPNIPELEDAVANAKSEGMEAAAKIAREHICTSRCKGPDGACCCDSVIAEDITAAKDGGTK